MPETVLTNRTPNAAAFQAAVARELRATAEQSQRVGSDGIKAKAHQRLLELTAEHVLSLDASTDQHLRALQRAGVLRGDQVKADSFAPGPKTRKVIASAGLTPGTPTPTEVLDELVAQGQEDLYDVLTANQGVQLERERQQIEQSASDRIDQEVTRAQDSEAETRTALEAARAENAELKKTVGYLQDRLAPAEEKQVEKKQVEKKPKTTKKKKVAA